MAAVTPMSSGQSTEISEVDMPLAIRVQAGYSLGTVSLPTLLPKGDSESRGIP